MKPELQYRRLPGRCYGLCWSHALWRSDDHLLAVHQLPGSESYRRFYLRDIEAIVIKRTRARLWINVGAGIAAALLLLPLAFLLTGEIAGAWFAMGALAPLTIVIANTARGPTCEVRVQTAVQFERVGALSRLGVARRVLAPLAAEILAVQNATVDSGTVSPSGS